LGPRPARSGKSSPATALDAAHLEKRAAPAGVLDERRGRVERLEHVVPDPRVMLAIIDHGPRFVGDRLRLHERHPEPHPERRRR
jgi:hypothetical protein